MLCLGKWEADEKRTLQTFKLLLRVENFDKNQNRI
jgi:hypothetical protein